MPHIIVEYSANLEHDLSIPDLIRAVHRTALTTGVFPIGGLRTRAERRDVFVVADDAPDNAFIAIVARIGAGRAPEVRKMVAEKLLEVVAGVTAEVFAARGLGITVEVAEIDPTASLKLNNLHERLSRKEPAP